MLYSGNIGEKQGLEKVIDAAERLRDRPLILRLSAGAARRGWRTWPANAAANIKFLPLQPYDALPALLKMGDCHLVVQSAARRMRYCPQAD